MRSVILSAVFIAIVSAMIPIGDDGFYHPKTEQEIQELVKYAYDNNIEIRVRGAGHSVPGAIYTDGYGNKTNNLNLMLNLYNQVLSFEENQFKSNATMVVQSGIHLGYDPYDPTHTSTKENGLISIIDKKGYSFPDLGGIVQQTVGGFISTGSAGGSLQYSFLDDCLLSLRIITGTGDIVEFSEDIDSDRFRAAGVSLGLFGIISTAKFVVFPRYDIMGQEKTTKTVDCQLDLFGDHPLKPSLTDFLYKIPYGRLVWWPQQGLDKMIVWEAVKMKESDYTVMTNPPLGPPAPFVPNPYHEVGPPILGSYQIPQYLGGLFFKLIGSFPRWLEFLDLPPGSQEKAQALLTADFKYILPLVLDFFVPTGTKFFWDWWGGIAMDQEVNLFFIPVEFVEMWVPIENTTEVMRVLRDHFKEGINATGTFSTELYATKKSKFWLSCAYEMDVFRIDMYWFARNDQGPEKFYQQYWDLLKPFKYRSHWGKFSPVEPAYVRERFPMLGKWMQYREQYDPKQIFVTDYWRERLAIPLPPHKKEKAKSEL